MDKILQYTNTYSLVRAIPVCAECTTTTSKTYLRPHHKNQEIKNQEKSSVVNAGKATRTRDLQEILAAKFGGDKT